MEQLEYFGSIRKRPTGSEMWRITVACAGAIVTVNAAMTAAAMLVPAGGPEIAMFLLPAMNLVMMIVSLCLIPLTVRGGKVRSVVAQVVVAIVVPTVVGGGNMLLLLVVFPGGISGR